MKYTNFADHFGIIKRRSQALIVEACAEYHLNYSEFALLLKLVEQEGCSQDDLVASLCVDKAAVTRVIKEMEDRGFLYREQSQEDRRVKRVYLTEVGHKSQPHINDILAKLVDFLYSGMSKEQAQATMDGIQIASNMLAKADYQTIFGKK